MKRKVIFPLGITQTFYLFLKQKMSIKTPGCCSSKLKCQNFFLERIMSYPGQYVQYKICDYNHDNFSGKYSKIVDKIISTYIDHDTLLKIEENTILSLYDLLTPIENHRTLKIPRPQNSFVIYRRNLQAKMALSNTPNSSLER